MAGKPEQPSTHPVPPNHGHHHHQQLQQHQQLHQQQQQQQQQQQGIQQNSVLVYVSGENFAYATAVGQNAENATAVGYQSAAQQAAYAAAAAAATGIPVPTNFPAKNAVYASPTVDAAGGCCRLKNNLEYTVVTGDDGTECQRDVSSRSSSRNLGTNEEEQQQQQQGYSLYCETTTVSFGNGQSTNSSSSSSSINSNNNNNSNNSDSLSSSETVGRDGKIVDMRQEPVEGITGAGIEPSTLNGSTEMVPGGKLFPAKLSNDQAAAAAASYSSVNLMESYNGGRMMQANPVELEMLGEDTRVAFGRNSSELQQGGGIFQDSEMEQQGGEDKSRQQDAFDNQAGSSMSSVSSLSSASSNLVLSNSGVSCGAASCDSGRSEAGESSAYSSLSSPESQSQPALEQLSATNNACAQQAARSASRIVSANNNNITANPMHQHNILLPINANALLAHQLAPITVPRGWKRICTNGVIIYIRGDRTNTDAFQYFGIQVVNNNANLIVTDKSDQE
ncbi:uncharacterized protein [Prorops nasuta]|uniref:uncharacterized protein n=1 Tax=Prorops nasuta TaxID=863751 RepID=UPI0034CEBDEA